MSGPTNFSMDYEEIYLRVLNEEKPVGFLYHIFSFDQFYEIVKEDKIAPKYGFGDISFTRDKYRQQYLGEEAGACFKIEVDGTLLSNNYRIVPTSDPRMTITKKTNPTWGREEIIDFNNANDEMEEVVSKPIVQAHKYITKFIVISSKWKIYEDFLKPGTSDYKWRKKEGEQYIFYGDSRKYYPNTIADMVRSAPVSWYVQNGNLIYRDDNFWQNHLFRYIGDQDE